MFVGVETLDTEERESGVSAGVDVFGIVEGFEEEDLEEGVFEKELPEEESQNLGRLSPEPLAVFALALAPEPASAPFLLSPEPSPSPPSAVSDSAPESISVSAFAFASVSASAFPSPVQYPLSPDPPSPSSVSKHVPALGCKPHSPSPRKTYYRHHHRH